VEPHYLRTKGEDLETAPRDWTARLVRGVAVRRNSACQPAEWARDPSCEATMATRYPEPLKCVSRGMRRPRRAAFADDTAYPTVVGPGLVLACRGTDHRLRV